MKPISPDHPEVPHLLNLAIGFPTDEKIKAVVDSYRQDNHYFFGFRSGGQISGLMGIELQENRVIIEHIAVLESHRSMGIGRAMIQGLRSSYSAYNVHAETDDDAVRFYRRCDFLCEEIQGKYGRRYRCILERE